PPRPRPAPQQAGHAPPFVDAPRRGGRPDRSGLLDVVRAVRHRTPAEMVPLVLAGESLALGGPGHVDQFARREQIRFEGLANRIGGVGLEPDLLEVAMGLDPRLLEMTGDGPGQLLLLDLAEAELDRAVAVLLDGSQANHGAGAGLENGDRQELTLLGEHLGHPDLL